MQSNHKLPDPSDCLKVPEDWREMEAGEDLDILIASKLGYSMFTRSGIGFHLIWAWRYARPDDLPHHIFQMDNGPMVNEPIPEYSRNADAALYWLKIPNYHLFLIGGSSGSWSAHYGKGFNPRWDRGLQVAKDSPALAICFAWLEFIW